MRCTVPQAEELERQARDSGAILTFDRIAYYESFEELQKAAKAAEISAAAKLDGTGLALL